MLTTLARDLVCPLRRAAVHAVTVGVALLVTHGAAVHADDKEHGKGHENGDDRHKKAGVVLQPHTHVASPKLRDALTSYDAATGTMRFTRVSDATDLKVGDVLVSEPSKAAPFGYLRKVTAVSKGGDAVTLTTVQARLNDAIQNAHASVTLVLPTDGSHTASVVPGELAFPAAPITAATPTSTAGVGTNKRIDVEYHTSDVALSIHGYETAWVGVNLSFDIDGWCIVDGDPCFTFDASAGLQEDAALDIKGHFNTTFSTSYEVAHQTFDPIVFMVGPVPVVLVPQLDINLEFNGSASGSFAYAGRATAPQYQMSIHWDSGKGFSHGSSSQPAHIDPGAIDLEAQADAHARLPTRMQVALYDVLGVNTLLTAGLDAKVQIPHKPRWSVDGRIKGEMGVDAQLPIIGDLGSTEVTLFDEPFHVQESTNNPPRVSITAPANGQQFDMSLGGLIAPLSAQVADDEDGTPCCTLDWLLADGTVIAHGNGASFSAPHEGHFDIAARATDSDGASSTSAPVGVEVMSTPQGGHILLPGPACESKIYTNLPVRLLGVDDQHLGSRSYRCLWSSGNAADTPQFPPAVVPAAGLSRGCELDTFFPTAGPRLLELDIVPIEPDGSPSPDVSYDFKLLSVTDAPAGAIPILREPGPAACEVVALDSEHGTLETWVEFRNPVLGGQRSWTWQAGSCAPVTLPVQQLPNAQCTPDYCPLHFMISGPDVVAITPASCGGSPTARFSGTVVIATTDVSGASNSTQFSINLEHQIVR
jgi:hypothetical protein